VTSRGAAMGCFDTQEPMMGSFFNLLEVFKQIQNPPLDTAMVLSILPEMKRLKIFKNI